MATNPTTDLTEEDAADLQFPKECMQKSYSVRKTEFHYTANRPIDLEKSLQTCDLCFSISRLCSCNKCAKCSVSLQVPFIECTQCDNVSLCCRCFASGSELESHTSDHNYRVIKNDFILFDKSNWTAAEELTMLDTMYSCGYGNWELIAKKLGNRTIDEIRDHYNKFYIDQPVSDILPKVSETVQSLFPKPTVPFRYKLTDIEEPPRYAPHTFGYQSVAGYNAARSDFESEYDANAEEQLALLSAKDIDVTDTHYDTLTELQCCIIRSYNRRLRERQRRKNIIKAHGLILIRKTMSWMHRYDSTLTRSVTERMLCFMQFLSGCEFDFIMEGLHHAVELKQKIARLCEYRRKGITSLQAAEVYESLKNEREQHEKELNAFVSNPLFNWKKLMPVYVQPVNVTNKRSQYRPLDIIGLPGFEKLSAKEQELCSTVRLVPQTYFELKDLLVTENKKFGYLKLKTARKMLKIDVNKTRKLYDFLAKEGYIVKTAS